MPERTWVIASTLLMLSGAFAPIAKAQTSQPQSAGVRVADMKGLGADSLVKLLQAEKDPNVRWEATVALGELDDPRAIAPLMDVVRNDPSNRRAAALLLGQLEAWEAVDLILEVLLDKDGVSRDFAARGLKALSGEDFGEDATLWRNWWLAEQKIAPTTVPDDLRVTVVKLSEKTTLRLALIPAGQFLMGGAKAESRDRETPAHRVKITKPFYLGQTEVTQRQYEAVIGRNPSHVKHKDANNPVDSVSWDDAVAFCRKLSAGTGHTFRLPTEAEWEYACRAGVTRPYFYVHDRRSRYAWNSRNSEGRTQPVGLKLPNAFGLNDMFGNAAEWCSDWAGEYPDAPATDPQGPAAGKRRIVRGGKFDDDTFRSSDRNSARPDEKLNWCGFRVVMEGE